MDKPYPGEKWYQIGTSSDVEIVRVEYIHPKIWVAFRNSLPNGDFGHEHVKSLKWFMERHVKDCGSEDDDKVAQGLVLGYFNGDEHKTELWFSSPIPLLGNLTPNGLLAMGRGDKLLKFIRNQLAENER